MNHTSPPFRKPSCLEEAPHDSSDHEPALVSKERPLVLTEPAENAASERSITGPRQLVELRSELAAVQKAVWAVFAAVVLIGIFLLMK